MKEKFNIYQPWLFATAREFKTTYERAYEYAMQETKLSSTQKTYIHCERNFLENGCPTIFISNQSLIEAVFNAKFEVDLETIKFPCQSDIIPERAFNLAFAFKEGLEIEGVPLSGIMISKGYCKDIDYFCLTVSNDFSFNLPIQQANDLLNQNFWEAKDMKGKNAFGYYAVRVALGLLTFFSACPKMIKQGLPLLENTPKTKMRPFHINSAEFDETQTNSLKKIVYVNWHFKTLKHERYRAGGEIPRTIFVAPYMKGFQVNANYISGAQSAP